jgi:polygalacturonase
MTSLYNLREFGAAGDGRTKDTAALQRAIDACAAGGGGSVLVPAGGAYLIGQVNLRSHVNLHVEGGGRLVASFDPADYPDRTLIRATGAENVAITGLGVIDGRGEQFMRRDDRYIFWLDRGRDFRPRLIQLIGCRNVTLRDVTLTDAPAWAVHPIGCQDVLIHSIRILNSLKVPNCDGIDPDNCRNVRISDCHIEAGDDCIVLKSSREHRDFGPCENVTVTGCTLISTSCALKIGTGPWSAIRDVVFDGCVIKSSNRGLGIQLRDPGDIENILFSNIIVETRLFHDDWWGKAEPIHISTAPRSPGAALGRVRHVRFRNILCRGESGAFISGCPDSVIEDVALESVRIEIDKTSKWPGGLHDRRPPEDDRHLYAHRTAGVFVEHAARVALRDVEVVWGENRPGYFGPALEYHQVEGLELRDFRGESAHPERCPAIVAAAGP